MGEDEGQFSKLGNLLSPGIEEKWSGIAIFEYSWFRLLLCNSACFKGRGLWDPVQSRLKHSVSTLAVGLSDTEQALLPPAMPSPTQTPTGAHHSTLNTQNKTRGSKPGNLSHHLCGLLTSGGYPSYKRRGLPVEPGKLKRKI